MTRARILSPSAPLSPARRLAVALVAALSLMMVGPATPAADGLVLERDRIPTPAAALVPMASVGGAELVVPAVDIAAVGFHQGGTAGMTLSPAGDNVVMPSRGRNTSPTSAVDIAVGADRTVTSPVDGTVEVVSGYTLYGNFPDVIVHIIPDDADVTVRMMHLTDVSVAAGDRVRAGEPIAQARLLPVPSQVDRLHDGPAGPHVHLDVARR